MGMKVPAAAMVAFLERFFTAGSILGVVGGTTGALQCSQPSKLLIEFHPKNVPHLIVPSVDLVVELGAGETLGVGVA